MDKIKNICFCIKIHIPVISLNYRFFNIDRNHSYFDEKRLSQHIKRVCSEKLNPLLENIQKESDTSNGAFKVAVSISGSALTRLLKYEPQTVKLLDKLSKSNTIEFLSEPWTQSILPYINSKLLIDQTNLHDSLISSTFKKVPEVFIVHSPECLPNLPEFILNNGLKGIFSYANHLENKIPGPQIKEESKLTTRQNIFLINNKLSQLFYDADINFWKLREKGTSSVLRKFKNRISGNYPAIVVYNPLSGLHTFSGENSFPAWNWLTNRLLHEKFYRFRFPSEIATVHTNFYEKKNWSRKLLNPFKLQNVWLENKLQKDAYHKLKEINSMMDKVQDKLLIATWNPVQDMENLFYINSKFAEEEFSAKWVNPFSSPYMAYINYMNILYDFQGRIIRQKANFQLRVRKKKEAELKMLD